MDMFYLIKIFIIISLHAQCHGSLPDVIRERVHIYEDQLHDIICKDNQTVEDKLKIVCLINEIDNKYAGYISDTKLSCLHSMRKLALKSIEQKQP